MENSSTKYQRWYSALCARGVGRLATGVAKRGYEDHHISPKSHGGTDAKNNLARLTPREHFIAHLLLYKIHKDRSMALALWSMSNIRGRKIGSRIYEDLRRVMVQVGRKSISTINADVERKRANNERSRQFMRELWSDEAYRSRKAKVVFTEVQIKAQRKRAAALLKREGFAERLAEARRKKFAEPEFAEKIARISREGMTRRNREQGLAFKGGAAAKAALSKKTRCVETGIIFNSLGDATAWVSRQRGMKANAGNLSSACTGKLKTAYGFRWEHVS